MKHWIFVVVGLVGCAGSEDSLDESSQSIKGKLKDKCAKKPHKKCVVTTATVSPEGGTITTSDGVVLEVPYGAVDTPVTLTVTTTTLDPEPGLDAVSPVYAFEPEGTVFVRPIEVRLPRPAGVSNAQVYWTKLGSTEFEPVASRVEGDAIVATTNHFSLAVLGAPVPHVTIHGESFTTYLTAYSPRVSVADGIPFNEIGAWVLDGNGDFAPMLEAEADPIGTGHFQIPGVPTNGDYILKHRDRYLVSTSGTPDLGASRGGLSDRQTEPGLTIELTVTDMPAWVPGSQLEMFSTEADDWGFQLEYLDNGEYQADPQIAPNATTAAILMDLEILGNTSPGYIKAGYHTVIAQLLAETSPTGIPYQYMHQIGHVPTTFDMTVSNAASVALDTPIGDSKRLNIDFRGDLFADAIQSTASGVPQVVLSGLGVLTQAYDADEGFYTANADLLLVLDYEQPCTRWTTGDMKYGDSSLLGGAWGDLFLVRCDARTPYQLPGTRWAGGGARGANGIDWVTRVPTSGAVITPPMSAPRDVRIDGRPFHDGGTSVSETPVLTWTKPAIGKDAASCTDPATDATTTEACIVHYQLVIRRLGVNQNAVTTGQVVARIVTPNTELRVPPGILDPADTYAFTLVAVGGTAGATVERLRLTPFRQANDLITAATSSGVFGDLRGPLLEAQETIVPGQQFPIGLAVTDTHLYWIERGESPWDDPVPHTLSGRLWRASLDANARDPQILVENLPDPHSISIEGNQLYWTNMGADDGSIQFVDLANCQPGACPVTTLVEHVGVSNGNGLVVRDGDVYWLGEGLRVIRATDPCRPDPTLVPCTIEQLANDYGVSLDVDATYVYWTNYGDSNPGSGAVLRVRRDGTSGLISDPIATGGSQTWDVHVGGGAFSARVFWGNQAWELPFPASIESVPFDNVVDPTANHVTVATGRALFESEIMKVFGLDATHAYYIDTYDRLMKAPLDGSGPEIEIGVLADGGCPQGNIVVKNGTVYWTDTCSQAVHAVAIP